MTKTSKTRRPPESYRAYLRNLRVPGRNRTQDQVHKAGVRSREGSLRDLQAELQIKAMARVGQLPPPNTKEGQALRAILASYAPKIGPGRRNIHTLHRKIVLGVLRDHAKAKAKVNASN